MSNMSQVRTLISEMFEQIDAANDTPVTGDPTGHWRNARQRLIKLRLLIATAPVEFQNELTRLKYNDSTSIAEMLNQVESEINEGAAGANSIDRLSIQMPYDAAHDLPLFGEAE